MYPRRISGRKKRLFPSRLMDHVHSRPLVSNRGVTCNGTGRRSVFSRAVSVSTLASITVKGLSSFALIIKDRHVRTNVCMFLTGRIISWSSNCRNRSNRRFTTNWKPRRRAAGISPTDGAYRLIRMPNSVLLTFPRAISYPSIWTRYYSETPGCSPTFTSFWVTRR